MQVWVNTDDIHNVGALSEALDKAVQAHSGQELKAFIIFINPKGESPEVLTKRLEALAAEKKLAKVALAYLPGPKDSAVQDYRINMDPKVKNTVFVYKNVAVADKFVNLTGDQKGVTALNKAIAEVLK